MFRKLFEPASSFVARIENKTKEKNYMDDFYEWQVSALRYTRFEGLDDTLLAELRAMIEMPNPDHNLIRAGIDRLESMQSDRALAFRSVENELSGMRFEGLDDTLLADLRILVRAPEVDRDLIKAGYDHLVKLESERPAKIAARVRARLEGGE